MNPPLHEAAQAPEAPPSAGREAAEHVDPPGRPVVAMADDKAPATTPARRSLAQSPARPTRRAARTSARALCPHRRRAGRGRGAAVRALRRPARSPFWAAVHSHLLARRDHRRPRRRRRHGLLGAARAPAHRREHPRARHREPRARQHDQVRRTAVERGRVGLRARLPGRIRLPHRQRESRWRLDDEAWRRPVHAPVESLAALLPASITSSAVATDLKNQFSFQVSKCAKIPTRKVRWACLQPGAVEQRHAWRSESCPGSPWHTQLQHRVRAPARAAKVPREAQ